MTVWDVFTYLHEARVVAARLELWRRFAPDVEHRPVALIGDRTHRGRRHTVTPPAGVESHVVRLDAGSDWAREAQQRDAVRSLLPQMHPDDLVLLCDADELVDPRRLPTILTMTGLLGPCRMQMTLWYYGLRWRDPGPWIQPGACRARDLPEHPTRGLQRNAGLPTVTWAGWHLSYFGDANYVDTKLASFAHAEHDNPGQRALVARGAVEGVDPHGRPLVDDPLTGPLVGILAALR